MGSLIFDLSEDQLQDIYRSAKEVHVVEKERKVLIGRLVV